MCIRTPQGVKKTIDEINENLEVWFQTTIDLHVKENKKTVKNQK